MSKPTYGWKAMCSGFPTTHESFDLGKPFKHYKPITANGPNIRTVLEVTVHTQHVCPAESNIANTRSQTLSKVQNGCDCYFAIYAKVQ